MAKIYIASSGENQYFPNVVNRLRDCGHKIYDFRNPPRDKSFFTLQGIYSKEEKKSVFQYKQRLQHSDSDEQFNAHLDALNWADICFLILPCGRNALIEAGWMKGIGKKVIAYVPVMHETELMYQLFDIITDDLDIIIQYLNPSAQRRVIEVKKMSEGDKKMISRAEVTITDYGLSVRCYMRTNGFCDIPLDPESNAKNGESVDIDKAEWVTREEDGVSYDYIRVNY